MFSQLKQTARATRRDSNGNKFGLFAWGRSVAENLLFHYLVRRGY